MLLLVVTDCTYGSISLSRMLLLAVTDTCSGVRPERYFCLHLDVQLTSRQSPSILPFQGGAQGVNPSQEATSGISFAGPNFAGEGRPSEASRYLLRHVFVIRCFPGAE